MRNIHDSDLYPLTLRCSNCGTGHLDVPNGDQGRCRKCNTPLNPRQRRRPPAPRFSTSVYEFAHGKRPYGLGVWAFRDRCKPDALEHTVFTPRAMPFGEAKKWAREALPEATVIEVCP